MKRSARYRQATVLGIETSCDETSAAVVRASRALSSVVSSQIEMHEPFKGVVPELASRAHQQKISAVVARALDKAFPGSKLADLADKVDAVAFTQGPGLVGALLVGKVAARTLAWLCGLPLIGVNHLEAHALAHEFVRKMEFPFLSLIVSGGHTDLMLARGYGRYRVLGRTRDDAAGEAFDKVARLLNLGYPGGPAIDRMARTGNRDAIEFPRVMMDGSWDFSFSGLKTAVLYYTRQHKEFQIADVCASFQEAVVETLTEKALSAARRLGVPRLTVGGGVAANSRLREMLQKRGAEQGVDVLFTPMAYCTDNGAMIAHVGARRLEHQSRPFPKSWRVDSELPVRSWS